MIKHEYASLCSVVTEDDESANGAPPPSNITGGDAESGSVTVETAVLSLKFIALPASGGSYLTGALSVALIDHLPTALSGITATYLAWTSGIATGVK